MWQIYGGVIHGVNSINMDYFIHISTGTKVECDLTRQKDVIYLIPDTITQEDLKRCIEDADLSISTVKKLKDIMEIRDPNSQLHKEELIDCNKYYLNGIYEIIYCIHKYYFPRAKRIECQVNLEDEICHLKVEFSK